MCKSCKEPLTVQNDGVYIHLPFLEDSDIVAIPAFWTQPERMSYIRINSWPAVVCQQIGYNCFLRVRHVRHIYPTVNLLLEITILAMSLSIACTETLGYTQSIRKSFSKAQGFLTILLEKGESQNVWRRLPHGHIGAHVCTCAHVRKANYKSAKILEARGSRRAKEVGRCLVTLCMGLLLLQSTLETVQSLCALLQHAEATKPCKGVHSPSGAYKLV
jgi:hypothetical protein